MAKPCPINRVEFAQRAKPMKVTLEYEGKTYTAYVQVKEFESGSLGWNLSDKWGSSTTQSGGPCLDGRDVPVQIGLNITAIGSKELPKAVKPAA